MSAPDLFGVMREAPAPAAAPGSFTPEQLRRLERLRNRPTLYEAEIVRPDGERALLAYCSLRSARGLSDALGNRTVLVLNFLAAPRTATVEQFKAPGYPTPCLRITGGGVIRFTGRTQRDAIIEAREMTYVGDWK